MAISHGQSLHCSIMGNSLSSLQEVLKTMSIKLNLAEMLPVRSCTNDATLLSYIWQQRYQLKFLIISHELNPGEQCGSCEPLCDFFHLSYNYKCMCFNLNIQWRSRDKNGCLLSIAKRVYFLFRKQRPTAYLLVCMYIVATLLDIKWFRIWIT